MKKILLVDFFNLFIRCYSTIKDVNEEGRHVGAITGSLMSLYSLYKKFEPNYIFLCYEGKNSGARRRKSFHDYKDGRKSPHTVFGDSFTSPDEFWNELKLFHNLVSLLPICNLSIDYLEADDLISYLNFRFKDESKIIMSTDEDYYQLIDDNSTIYSPAKKNLAGEKGIIVDKKYLKEKFDILPENWLLRKSLMGDKSDNVEKSIKGLGNKTIQKLFPELGEKSFSIDSFVDLIKSKDEKNKKIKELILDHNIEKIRNNFDLMNLLDFNKIFSLRNKTAIENQLKDWDENVELDLFNLDLLLQKNMINLPISFQTFSFMFKRLHYDAQQFKGFI